MYASSRVTLIPLIDAYVNMGALWCVHDSEGPRGPAPDDSGGDEDGAQGGGAEGRRDNQGQLHPEERVDMGSVLVEISDRPE